MKSSPPPSRVLLALCLAAGLSPSPASAVKPKLRMKPKVKAAPRGTTKPKPKKSLKETLTSPRHWRSVRRRRNVIESEATLGKNPKRYTNKKKGKENPEHIRGQDKLTRRADEIAEKQGDELLGPAVAYYRTTHGRLLRVKPNKGTGNLREAARLRPGERLARLEQVGFVTKNGDGLVRVASNGSRRIGVLSRPTAAAGGVLLTGAAFFARDVFRWIGIREGADIVQENVIPEEPVEPEIIVGPDGDILIDGDGDGESDVEIERPDRVVVDGDGDGRADVEIPDGATITGGEDGQGEDVLVISPGEDGELPNFDDLPAYP